MEAKKIEGTIEALRETVAGHVSEAPDMGAENVTTERYWESLDLSQDCPRASMLGQRITYEWLGVAPLDQIQIVQVDNTFQIDADTLVAVDDSWNADIEKGLKRFDGAQIRFEGAEFADDHLTLKIGGSSTSYRLHNQLRNPDFWEKIGKEYPTERAEFPNPLTINVVQVTTDGKILLGVKNGKVSDQTDIGLLGAGFVGRERPGEAEAPNLLKPKALTERMKAECEGETAYNSESPFDADDARALAVINGSNTDTTVTIFLPLKVHSSMVDVGNHEHSEMVLLDDDEESILEFVQRTEVVDGKERFMVADHGIGSIEAYLMAKKAGLIDHPYRLPEPQRS